MSSELKQISKRKLTLLKKMYSSAYKIVVISKGWNWNSSPQYFICWGDGGRFIEHPGRLAGGCAGSIKIQGTDTS